MIPRSHRGDQEFESPPAHIYIKINFFLLSFFQINNKNCLINTHKENDFLQNREKIIIKFSIIKAVQLKLRISALKQRIL